MNRGRGRSCRRVGEHVEDCSELIRKTGISLEICSKMTRDMKDSFVKGGSCGPCGCGGQRTRNIKQE